MRPEVIPNETRQDWSQSPRYHRDIPRFDDCRKNAADWSVGSGSALAQYSPHCQEKGMGTVQSGTNVISYQWQGVDQHQQQQQYITTPTPRSSYRQESSNKNYGGPTLPLTPEQSQNFLSWKNNTENFTDSNNASFKSKTSKRLKSRRRENKDRNRSQSYDEAYRFTDLRDFQF
eukprot:CAMPEP_0172523836 /NCGR_PEP_ID=MMETSP1066-20121228/293868_1 /TAXON_ID=671091 /ORGANISM="Coscinodiscus wailesii, Strain CCMP2513" /LENGTH=173 /DNA_ID=CAMNT_0013306927 /DNA_START=1227 /DNA_END=1748 /DNA_ORIENTATION=-